MTNTAPIGAAGATPPTGAAGPTPKAANQSYNSDLFLKLLVTQLSNQDPSAPMDSAQMVSQTAQLASMEQLTSLNSTVSDTYQTQMQSTATSMLGKKVSWTDADGTKQSGSVSAIAFSSTGDPQLTVGDKTVGMGAITGVTAAS
jgi:flagellar basal-body rod modification protein FlgD